MESNPHTLKWKFQTKRRRIISAQKEDQVKREIKSEEKTPV
jgi:hypothetical protein